MKAKVYSLDGKAGKEVQLPEVFEEVYRPLLISRAVTAEQSHRLQPHAPAFNAGFKTTAEYIGRRQAFRSGINRGISRLPRVKTGGGGLGAVRRVAHAVGGRRAHPPKVDKVLVKKINKKEKKTALRSAIAATANKVLVEKRGHIVKYVPLVVEDKLETLKKTKDAVSALKKLGVEDDLLRAKKKKIRAGKGTKRGRKYKKKKSVLVVLGEDKGAEKALRNIQGIDVVKYDRLTVELLAPGAQAGRATIWTESALKKMGGGA